MTESQPTLSELITVFVIAGVVLLPWITLATAEFCLWLYRRKVVTSMRGGGEPLAAAAAAAGERRTVRLDVQTADEATSAHSSLGGTRYERWRRAVRETTGVYVAAGAVYALVLTAAYVFRLRTPLSTAPALVLGFSWPLVLTALLVAVPRRRRQVQLIALYWIVFFSACVPLDSEKAILLVGANIVATMMALVVRGRRIRAVAPLVGAFYTVIGIALLTIIGALMMVGQRSDDREITGLEVLVVVALVFAMPVVGATGAWRALRGIGRWYAEKRTSDQTITTAAIWLCFAGVHATTVAYDDVRWMAVGLLAFAAFVFVTTIGFRRLHRRSTRDEAPRLLVLRVFALGRHSRRLFDRLTARWRHIGSVQLIAGPDLASSTVEPHEFFDFLCRRLGGRFLADTAAVGRALAALDTRPDHDGRYRITDFFCRDSVWRSVFARLALGSDVVLMDLRGFSRANCGCTYELSELLNLVPIDRLALVVDGSTDADFLTQTLEGASSCLSPASPNADNRALDVRVFRQDAGRAPDPDRLLRLLCERAAASTRPLAAAG